MSKQDVFGGAPEPEAVSNFLFNATKYIIERRPHELMTIQILRELTYDVMDAEMGRRRELAIQ